MDNDFPDIFLEKLEQARYYDSGYVTALCIFHPDTRPSLLIYPDRYRCLSCEAHGSTSSLIEKLDTLHFASKKKQENYGYNPFSKWLKSAEIWKIISLASRNVPIKYLETRFIIANIQRELRLGLMDGWITFPITNEKEYIVGAVARAGEGNNSRSKYVLPKGQNANLLYVPSWERCISQDTIYLTFGIIDSISLYAAGFAAMSTTTGKHINASAFDIIRKSIRIIPDFGEDVDALRLASKLGWRGKVLRLPYTDNAKDVNDLICKAGLSLNELRRMINE